MEKIILAGGCFWGMQDLIRKIKGVTSTRVGYSGGQTLNPTYKDMCTGQTGHAEAVEITFDPTQTNLRTILLFFFQAHDPTTMNRQGNDTGTQYRSAIFFADDMQKDIAIKVISDIEASKKWPGKIVTEVTKAGTFYEAEKFHQDYLIHNPGGYTCHFIRRDWVL